MRRSRKSKREREEEEDEDEPVKKKRVVGAAVDGVGYSCGRERERV